MDAIIVFQISSVIEKHQPVRLTITNRSDWPIMNDNYTINYDLTQFLVLCIDCTPAADLDGANGHGGK